MWRNVEPHICMNAFKFFIVSVCLYIQIAFYFNQTYELIEFQPIIVLLSAVL